MKNSSRVIKRKLFLPLISCLLCNVKWFTWHCKNVNILWEWVFVGIVMLYKISEGIDIYGNHLKSGTEPKAGVS